MSNTADKLSLLVASPKEEPVSYFKGVVQQTQGSKAYVLIDGGVSLWCDAMDVKALADDRVRVEVRKRKATLIANYSHPVTDDALANDAYGLAQVANNAASDAQAAADDAIEDAGLAKQAAEQAASDASSAAQSASEAATSAADAQTSASNAQASAQTAAQSATQAVADAGRAATAAENAEGSAAEASAQATAAAGSASDAASSAATAAGEAQRANQMANGALAGLSTLESVIDTVDWFAQHKKASTDTTVNPDKDYYTFDAATGTLSKVEPEGTENPSQQGWYELDEAISNYVASHTAMTDDGLYVVGLSNGWRVLVSTGAGDYAAGIFLIDPTGVIAQATTATGTTFDSGRPYYIGDEDAYIVFDGNGGITIGGDGVSISGGVTIGGYNKTLSEVMAALNASISAVEYGVGSSPTSHSDITSWSSSSPAWEQGKYVWMRTTTNGLTYTYTCIQGAQGKDGVAGKDGTNGKDGADAYTVMLTNESHTFAATADAAIDGSTTSTVIAYKGATKVAATIGTISGAPSGMSTSLSNNGTTSASFTVTATTSLKTQGGTLTVPVTVDGKSFSKSFTWALALKGDSGQNGKMLYGTCSTGASTTAKAVSCADATELYAGMTITVKFSTANTVLAPTLNVNSLGAKAIWVDNAVTSTSNCLFWNTNATITFTYDGTQWLVADQPTTYYTTCSTAAGTAAKAAPCTAGVVRKGTTVTATMSYAHSSSTAATLYVTGQSGTARTIYVNGATVTTANGNSWAAGESVPFVFNGQYWYASRGEKGEKGDTPSITATKSGGTTTIKVDGTTIATVDDGTDGTTPTVTTRTNQDGSTTIVINGSDSATIENGTDGKSYYTYVRYSANSDGSNMVTTPTTSTKYIGVYTGESSTVPAYTAFTWSKYVGENGTSPDPLTVTSTATDYQLSTNGTTAPTGSWSTTPLAPTATQYLWTRTTLTFSDGTSSTSYSVGGKAGTSVTVSSTATTYASSTSGTTAPSSGWQSSVPSVAQGSYLWTKVVTTFSDGKTATSLTSSRQGKDGEQGPQGPQGQTGPEAVVTISVDSVDWELDTATLRATLRVDGTAKTSGVTYKWTSGTSTTSLGTAQTLSVTNLNATYNCTCTW